MTWQGQQEPTPIKYRGVRATEKATTTVASKNRDADGGDDVGLLMLAC
jgi:hypothetical protein